MNEEIIVAFQKHKPHLLDIDTLVREVKYGKLNLELTIVNSFVTNLEVISKQSIRYDKGEALSKT